MLPWKCTNYDIVLTLEPSCSTESDQIRLFKAFIGMEEMKPNTRKESHDQNRSVCHRIIEGGFI